MDTVLTVRRWRRYGADRLFVTESTGARAGSVDLQSGEVVVDEPHLESMLRRAVQAYLRSDVTELVLPLPGPRDALDALDEAAMRAWLGPDGAPELDADRRERMERGNPVGVRLDRLAEEGWQALHDVPLGRQGTVVEHLLVGPGGIFTICERRHPGQRVCVEGRRIEVDGRPVPYLRDARLEAARVQGLLHASGVAAVTVRGMVVLQGELELSQEPRTQDAVAVSRQDVPAVFRQMPTRLDPDRVAAITAIARQRTTWLR
ncbi:nuclease-related domain-containing protein [Cellulomonas soli]|uniref:nuclease-related domain-containing protein n=1 Tax=Cellulomonas soli TaxID=931535 RepID=UPI003F867810